MGQVGPSHCSTSNTATAMMPFQRWYRFKEAFSPALVEKAVKSVSSLPRLCIDPFGGSGTTALTCQFLDVPTVTIEVNPFLADLIEAKLCRYDVSDLVHDRCAFAGAVNSESESRKRRSRRTGHVSLPPTFIEPGVRGRWIFSEAVAKRIQQFVSAIEEVESESHRRLFRVLLGSVLIPVSNVVISGKGRRYRGNWGTRVVDPHKVDELFDEAFRLALDDILRYEGRANPAYAVVRGDARVLLGTCPTADLILFSPPYPNSFDYTDIYNVELWMLGYLRAASDNRELREATLRSHVQIRREFDVSSNLDSPTLSGVLAALEAQKSLLWDSQIPGMIQSYFADLVTILSASRDKLALGGRVIAVVGDSRYAGVRIDVSQILRELAGKAQLECVKAETVRSMRTSAQQGGIEELGEVKLEFLRSPDS